MNVIDIHLYEAAVRLGWDEPFQVCSFLCADRLVSWVYQPCALRRRGQAFRRRSTFTWRPLSLLLFSYMCALPLACFFRLIFPCPYTMLHLLISLCSVYCLYYILPFSLPWFHLKACYYSACSCVPLLSPHRCSEFVLLLELFPCMSRLEKLANWPALLFFCPVNYVSANLGLQLGTVGESVLACCDPAHCCSASSCVSVASASTSLLMMWRAFP